MLIVGDEQTTPAAFLDALQAFDLTVDRASDGVTALSYVREHEYAVILVDLLLPRMDGASFLRAYGDLHPARRAVVFVMTAFDDGSLRKLDGTLVQGCVRKPFDVAIVSLMVRDCAALFEGGPSARLLDQRRGLRLVDKHS